MEALEIIDYKKFFDLSIEKRISLDFIFMQTAMLFSSRSECYRSQVGCVITKDGRIISVGYNGNVSGGKKCTYDNSCPLDNSGSCYNSIHAEQNAIAFCSKNGINTNESTIYVTLSPCLACSKLIIQSGIKKVIYLNEYRIKDGIDYLKEYNVETVKFESKLWILK